MTLEFLDSGNTSRALLRRMAKTIEDTVIMPEIALLTVSLQASLYGSNLLAELPTLSLVQDS